MSIKRKIIDFGEKVADFCAHGLQNYYYKYLFLANAKKYIGNKEYSVDNVFQQESIAYWKKQTGMKVNPIWHNFYSDRNSIRDVRYVPENIYYSKIEPFFNRKELTQSCDDKCFYTERFPESAFPGGFHRPATLLRNVSGIFYDVDFNILKDEEAAQLLSENTDGYVIKESITGAGGNRIVFVDEGEQKTKDELLTIFARYKRDYVVESLLKQCPEMAALNPSSINTIRFITFMDRDGVHLLSAVARMGGVSSKTDNFSTGGVACGIDENGVLKSVGYDQHYNRYTVHPNGHSFGGTKVPSYDKAVELVKNMHRRFGHFRIISWDIAIAPDYVPTIIEFNLTPQSIDFHQINNGPLFGDLTEKVLKEVFGK